MGKPKILSQGERERLLKTLAMENPPTFKIIARRFGITMEGCRRAASTIRQVKAREESR
jgi:hypothetical protein